MRSNVLTYRTPQCSGFSSQEWREAACTVPSELLGNTVLQRLPARFPLSSSRLPARFPLSSSVTLSYRGCLHGSL
ncbi:unnamed protein product [Arctogadus glacialis]